MTGTWELNGLLQRRLWIVTGKGGVGKTTVAAALGLLAARQGLKVLMVETHGLTHLAELFEAEGVGYEPKAFKNGLSLARIDPEPAFQEYVLRQVKFEFLYNAVFNNKYVRHFIDAAPGLAELLTIGKIWAFVEDEARRGKKPLFDLVIVDAPSTGHSLSLLTVPQVVVDAVRVGPLKNNAQQILALIRDPQKTLTWLVTLPEEMPVNEAVEMDEKLERQAKVGVGPVLLNSLWPEVLGADSLQDLKKAKVENPMLHLYRQRAEQSAFYRDRLRERLPGRQVLDLPLVYQTKQPVRIAESLSESIRAQLTGVRP
ncbi:ArsA family ATPase [Deltaproteobacteria bacterium PRO3]|nr:ArsA family ATPase [Deltaproteobacteria bacterium PRO3]